MAEPEERAIALVVDDDEAARLMTRIALEDAGFEVLEADDGVPALELFRTHAVDIVLLDVMMKRLDGFATCAAIRALPAGAMVPVVMMTGLEDVASINRAYDVGATDFETKPINYGALPHRARYILRSARNAKALRDSEARLDEAQRLARLGHFDWHATSGRLECSSVMAEIFNVPPDSGPVGLDFFSRDAHPEDRDALSTALQRALDELVPFSVGYRLQQTEGRTSHLHLEGSGKLDALTQERLVSGVVQDVTERRRLEGLAHRLTYFDALTGLPNRATLRKELGDAIAVAEDTGTSLAVLSIGLDGFTRINDTFGRQKGDLVLRAVGDRLSQCLRREGKVRPGGAPRVGNDLVARAGGDEFVAVLPGLRAVEDAAVVARRVLASINQPLRIDDEELVLSAAMGISVYPMDGSTPDQLTEHADAARNHAKAEGRGRSLYYTSSINARAFERLSMENNLRRALNQQQLELFYQPKLHLADGSILGAEALIRWRHPDLGLVSPVNFISIAEETGLIVPIGEWIARQACRDIMAWEAAGLGHLHVAINISAVQFEAEGLVPMLRDILAEYRVPYGRLEIELTESLLMDNTERSIEVMEALRDLGMPVWIDDFGTGYSSLSYLRRFPIAGVKVDQTFVREMDSNQSDAAIVAAVIALAKSLRLGVVAEGVESPQQAAALGALHCDYVQGYLYSPPLPAEKFVEWARSYRAGPP